MNSLDYKIIIPARSGSKGVPAKNIKNFCKKSLLELAIDFSCKTEASSIIVSTDSHEYIQKIKSLNIFKENIGKIQFHERSESAALDSSTDLDVVKDLISSEMLNKSDLIAWLRPTSPLRSIIEFNMALKKLKRLGSNCSTLRSIKRSSIHPYWMKKSINEDLLIESFIKNKDEKTFPNRQSLPKCFEISSEFDFIYVEKILSQGTFFPNPMYGYETELLPKVDIDTEQDFTFAETFYTKLILKK